MLRRSRLAATSELNFPHPGEVRGPKIPPLRRRAPALAQKSAYFPPECLEVHEERIMPLDAGEGGEAGRDAGGRECLRDGLLLAHREEQVRLHPDHQGVRESSAAKKGYRIPVYAQVEAVHRARYIKVAVGVVGGDPAGGERLQVTLDGELRGEGVR